MKKIIERIDFDSMTDLPFAEDIRGNMHMIDWKNTANVSDCPRIYLQTDLTDNYIWANNNTYQSIPDSFHPGNNLIYTVPPECSFHFAFVIGAACQRGPDFRLSMLGLFVNDERKMSAPIYRELDHVLYSPIIFIENTKVELKFKPGTTGTDFGIISGGYLIHR